MMIKQCQGVKFSLPREDPPEPVNTAGFLGDLGEREGHFEKPQKVQEFQEQAGLSSFVG